MDDNIIKIYSMMSFTLAQKITLMQKGTTCMYDYPDGKHHIIVPWSHYVVLMVV